MSIELVPGGKANCRSEDDAVVGADERARAADGNILQLLSGYEAVVVRRRVGDAGQADRLNPEVAPTVIPAI